MAKDLDKKKKKNKKSENAEKTFLISYYKEHSSSFSDKIYREIKNEVVEATSKKEAYAYWIKHVQSCPSIINIICLDDD